MATTVILPMLGQTMEEGTITKWFKKEGEKVKKGEPLLEVMTDKANMEVEAPVSGVLRKIVAQPDQTVPVMDMIGIIGTADEPIDDLLKGDDAPKTAAPAEKTVEIAPAAASEPVVESDSDRIRISPRARKVAGEQGVPIEALAGRGTGPEGRIVEKDVLAYAAASGGAKAKVTPLAARVAADQGIDLAAIVGTGPQGKITQSDLLQAAGPVKGPSIEAKVIPFAGMRKMVAEAVTQSNNSTVRVTLTSEVDMTEAMKLRGQVLPMFERKFGVKLTFTDIIVKAAALAILDHPIINSTLDGRGINIHGEVNVGVAVAIESGLVVPVVKNADSKPLNAISSEIKKLGEKARTTGLAPTDIGGGTFSVTNLGAYGVDDFDPVITPGQSAILGVCRIVEKPVVVDGQVVVRSMMNLCLTFDHRVMDGAPAALYLQRVKEILEAPAQVLI